MPPRPERTASRIRTTREAVMTLAIPAVLIVPAMLAMMLVGMPIAVSMAAVGIVGGVAAFGVPVHGLDRAGGLGRAEREPAHLRPAVRAARRAPAALGHRRPDVRRAVGVARPPARRPAAHQHRRLRAVRRDLRLVGRHRGDDRHRRAAVAARRAATRCAPRSARWPRAARSAS